MSPQSRNHSNGRKAKRWHRIIVRVEFANGNTYKHQDSVPEWRWDDARLLTCAKRLAILRAKVHGDLIALETRTFRNDTVQVELVPAGMKPAL